MKDTYGFYVAVLTRTFDEYEFDKDKRLFKTIDSFGVKAKGCKNGYTWTDLVMHEYILSD